MASSGFCCFFGWSPGAPQDNLPRISPTLPKVYHTNFFVMPRGLCGLSASNITALAGVAHLRWRSRFGCNEFPCLAVEMRSFQKIILSVDDWLNLSNWGWPFDRRFCVVFREWVYFGLGKNLRQTPGVRKFVANFSSELRVNIFQNRRKPSRRACSTGAGRCAKFDTSCIRWIRPLLEVNGRRFLRAWD